jgi:diadenosine tetraphosphate (Ap4A) HIT family hydrolase
MKDCPLCHSVGGELIWEDDRCRIVRVADADGLAFPGYCRVIWKAHTAEMSDLASHERQHLMKVVLAVESALREIAAPDKINLAALGNMVPHLHWHVIPRWRDDSHFPAAIWASPARPVPKGRAVPGVERLRPAIGAFLTQAGIAS